jgi:hypothetical protein
MLFSKALLAKASGAFSLVMLTATPPQMEPLSAHVITLR